MVRGHGGTSCHGGCQGGSLGVLLLTVVARFLCPVTIDGTMAGGSQVNSKGARMKGGPQWVVCSTLKRLRNKSFFTMHISALVPPCGPAGTSRACPQQIARTLVGQEHAPTPGPDPCGRLQSFWAARPWLRFSLGLGRTVLGHTYIPRLQSEALLALGSRWPSCIPFPRPILQNCRHHERKANERAGCCCSDG